MTPRILTSVALFALLATAVRAAESRTWSSKDGSASLVATFNKIDGDKVVLILPNGRSQTVDKQFLSDPDLQWIEENAGAATGGNAPADSSAPATSAIPTALNGKLIDDHGKPVDITTGGRAPQYYLFYYSASWCAPCKAFTPTLIQFYRKMKARKASFETVLVPADHSLEKEIAYLKDHRMPWPGVAFEQKNAPGIPQSKWGYIPAMVLADADGKVLLQVNDDMTKEEFLDKAAKIFADRGQTALN